MHTTKGVRMSWLRDTVFDLIVKEEQRQQETLMMIPSENYASPAVRAACSSVFMNKYAEGYPGRRYYEGNEVVDELEAHVQDLAKEVFGVSHANVQPYSGSPANSAAQMAILQPGDVIMGMALASGGHLTHGHPKITFSGSFFKSIQYGVDASGTIDFDKLAALAKQHRPRLIIAGTTAYPWILDFERFGAIADSVGAYLLADISHISGLVVAGVHPSPADCAHVITTTTHKTLRGPRGAMIMVTKRGMRKDPGLAQKINRAVFPGLQGGPHNNTVAAIGVALEEARSESFKTYGRQVVHNAMVLADELKRVGITVWGTENHLMLLDLTDFGGGMQVAYALGQAGIVANKNAVPHDTNPPLYPSGVRIGTPAVTTRGMGKPEMKQIAAWVSAVAAHCEKKRLPAAREERGDFAKRLKRELEQDAFLKEVRAEVRELCRLFPTDSGFAFGQQVGFIRPYQRFPAVPSNGRASAMPRAEKGSR
jgi:glycine hydroxymethyltransferase